MSAHTLDAFSMNPASRHVRDKLKTSFAAGAEELRDLRFSIILTARWEASDDMTPERRTELQAELFHLRHLYFEKIDEMAMAFGVQKAMKAQEEVERNVRLK